MKAHRIYEFRSRLEAELRAAGAPLPGFQSWMDAVDYNNELLDAVELVREVSHSTVAA